MAGSAQRLAGRNVSLCPFADQLLLPESHTQPTITPRLVILHSAAGKGSLHNFFAKSSNLESHFWVGEDGTIEQYIDTNVRADANLKANGFALSIETESTVAATERWNPVQAAAIVRLVGWICDEHRIPKRQVPTWDGSGIGWHNMFGTPGPWTPHAKSCPGLARTPQARDEIIPAVAAAGTKPAPKPTPTGELTMADIDAIMKRLDTQDAALKRIEKGVLIDEQSDSTVAGAEVKRDGSLKGWVLAIAGKVGATRDEAVALDPTRKS